jgi:CRISPR-associated protein Cmr5
MSIIQSQSQKDMAAVAKRVQEVQGKPWAKVYGGLCHSFPVMVKQAGLAQTLAFHQSKASAENDDSGSDRKQAHARLLSDVNAHFKDFDPGTASLTEYMRTSRRVLAIWIFYKRFAVSILKAQAGEAKDDN